MTLPIDSVLPEVLAALEQDRTVVLQASPGAGKTTRIPLALLDAPWLRGQRILMLEPRRVAARAAAGFMSGLLGEGVGRTVGYRMRMETRVCAQTRIEVVTEGVLARLVQDDPELSGYAAVIFDEFHERSLQGDLGLALVQDVRQALRDDLRLLVMSATLEADPLIRLLDGARSIVSAGREYPVASRHLPPGRGMTLSSHVAAVVDHVIREQEGSVLVFLPGEAEIRRVSEQLDGILPADVYTAPLYGGLDRQAQDAAIEPAPSGRRKVVVATNIAETSLTIHGIRVVVDSGLERCSRFDPVSGMDRLVTTRISRASAEQRAGRAGRLGPGICIRLWSSEEHQRLSPRRLPEILEADLSQLVLDLAQWGTGTPETLSWLDPPPPAAWGQAVSLLKHLGALDSAGGITSHGRAMHTLGMHPRLSHMLLRGRDLGWGQLAGELAVLLSERDILPGESRRQADLRMRVDRLRSEMRGRLHGLRAQARRLAGHQVGGASRSEDDDSVGILLGFAYPDRIGQRREAGVPRYLLANGRGARLRDDDHLRQVPFLVAAKLDGAGTDASIQLAAAVDADSVERHFTELMTREHKVFWDDVAGAVSARVQRRLGAIVLEDAPWEHADPERLLEVLIEGIRRKGLGVFPRRDATRQWQARVRFMAALEPGLWPDADDAALLADLEIWAAPFLQGVTRLSHLRGFPLQDALTAWLGYAAQQRLELQAPSRWRLPTGSRIAIDYRAGAVPVLAVRLQELFGETRTPTIADGRVSLLLHLLSPARRPVQVTRDLAGFWAGSYATVRRELRGRYPKHAWPDDPTATAPTRHARRGRRRQGETD